MQSFLDFHAVPHKLQFWMPKLIFARGHEPSELHADFPRRVARSLDLEEEMTACGRSGSRREVFHAHHPYHKRLSGINKSSVWLSFGCRRSCGSQLKQCRSSLRSWWRMAGHQWSGRLHVGGLFRGLFSPVYRWLSHLRSVNSSWRLLHVV